MQIGIVDYGVGNIRSILNALERLEINRVKVSSNGDELASTDGIILPGVGAFANVCQNCVKTT